MKRRISCFLLGLLLAVPLLWGVDQPAAQTLTPGLNGYLIPNYFGTTPNWAFSPQLTKFKDGLPGLTPAGASNVPGSLTNGQYIPIAAKEPAGQESYPGSDYYEIALVEFSQKMHSELPATRLRGYVQLSTAKVPGLQIPLTYPGGTPILINGTQARAVDNPRYLGPLIVADKDRPVRVLFRNLLPTGQGGRLFVPVDRTVEGSGPGPNTPTVIREGTPDDVICAQNPQYCYAENRATLHLHGGRTPWISDGTPHQWIVPAGEATPYLEGVSKENVPDMPDPGPGAQTFYWTNQQSARLMFYHDHAWGITRLNVYVGEAAGYLITDPKEAELTAAGGALAGLGVGIPLIIQDKTFVDGNPANPSYVFNTDPTWAWGAETAKIQSPKGPANYLVPTPRTGDLWWPHVYMPAQNPYNPDFSGVNPMGRWPWSYWFFPQTPICDSSPAAVYPFCIEYGPLVNPYNGPDSPSPWMPGTPNPSWGAEAFLDTPVVNGTAFPTLEVPAAKVRFRILNAAHDRFFNLQLYRAANRLGPTTAGAPGVPSFTGAASDLTEVAMVPAVINPLYPALWPTDGRAGGVPDPGTRGPAMIQIGTEGGFLPGPVVLPNQPVNWITDPTLFMAGLVMQQNEGGGTLFLAPAERADVIVDFSNFAGQTLILYNDAPAPWPALDPHYDYYTGSPDLFAEMGAYWGTLPGKGPNTRTIMQIRVAGAGGSAPPDDYDPAFLASLQAAFAGPSGVFASSQDPIIVGQVDYNSNYFAAPADCTAGSSFPCLAPNWGVSTIFDTSLSFQTVDPVSGTPGTTLTVPMGLKAIQDEQSETFDKYGRLSAKLGLQRLIAAGGAGFVTQNFVDPPTEIVNDGEIQIWKITHNGVDTHPVHFHLFDVQVINRVGWDGFIYLADLNELGWKDTVRISPLQDTIVALRPKTPTQPFGLPNSVRPLNPSMPIGATEGFTNIDPYTGQRFNPPISNQLFNFYWEYVWHCHILSHEEMDMMRSIVFRVTPVLPAVPGLSASATAAPLQVNLLWTDGTPVGSPATLGNLANEIGFRIQRATNSAFTQNLTEFTALANATAFADATVAPSTTYRYRVLAFNAAGSTAWSNTATVTTPAAPPAAPANLTATGGIGQVALSWSPSAGATSYQVMRSGLTGGPYAQIASVAAPGYTDTGLAANTPYFYVVRAGNTAGQSGNSNEASATTAPAAPGGLTAVPGNTQATLNWTGSAGAASYNVKRSATTGGPYTQIANVPGTTYINSGLTNGVTYYYVVTAVSAAGLESANSNQASATPGGGAAPPAAPSNLTLTRSGLSQNPPTVTVRFRDNAGNEAGFTLQRATNSAFTANLVSISVGPSAGTGATVTYLDNTVAPATRYWYRVQAGNAGGTSAWSNTANITTRGQLPATPAGVTVGNATRTSLTISWTYTSNGAPGPIRFDVQRSNNGTGGWNTVANNIAATTFTNTGLPANTTRYYRVRAVNADGNSPYTAAVSGRTLP